MKTWKIAATMTLVGIIAYGVAAHAQTASKPDPVKVDPKHYKVEFENESVRLLRASYAPGEKSMMHYHPNSTAIFLADGTARMTTPDGKSQDMPSKAGTTSWSPAGNHSPKNIGNKPFSVILIERKK